MKCPHCGEELVRSTKNPDYLLCYTCKKKYKAPASASREDAERRAAEERRTAQLNSVDAYTQMLDIGLDDDDDERGGHGGLIFLIILLLIVAALVVGYFVFNIDYVDYVKTIIGHIKGLIGK